MRIAAVPTDADILWRLYKTQDEIERIEGDLNDLQHSLGNLIDEAADRFAPAAAEEAMARYMAHHSGDAA